MPKALKSCPKSNKSPNLVTLMATLPIKDAHYSDLCYCTYLKLGTLEYGSICKKEIENLMATKLPIKTLLEIICQPFEENFGQTRAAAAVAY